MAVPANFPLELFLLTIMSCRLEHSFGQFETSYPACAPSHLVHPQPLCWQGSRRNSKRLWLHVSTAQQELKHRCVTNTVCIVNPEHSTALATVKKINSVPAKTSAVIEQENRPILLLMWNSIVDKTDQWRWFMFWYFQNYRIYLRLFPITCLSSRRFLRMLLCA